MTGIPVLDILVALLLVGYLVYGLRAGFVVSLASILGIGAGAVAAFFAMPFVSTWVADSPWRVPVILLVIVALIALGQTLGTLLGRQLRRRVDRSPLRVVDRLLGGATSLIAAALVLSMLAFSASSLGVPAISSAIGRSAVIGTINNLTPDPLRSALAEFRSLVIQDGIPRILDALGPIAPDTEAPFNTDTAALNAAAASVVKITGAAPACGQIQSGSGFVVADDRVVTNAHVVAGVREPVVQGPDGVAWPGRVVSFDEVHDLAVIAVDGLGLNPLPLTEDLVPGDRAAVDGYPRGGPFRSTPAVVRTVTTAQVPNIYGDSPSPIELYALAASVEEGNSGGPLLSQSGQVAGVVFAKSATSDAVGYALTTDKLAPVVRQSASLTSSVVAGHCTRR